MGAAVILVGDCRDVLRTLPAGSVQMCVTSPPYFGLRDYGVPGQIGLEPTLAEYISGMVAVFREVRRVLRDDGTLWLNIGDSYAAGGARTNNNGKGSLGLGRPDQHYEIKNKVLGTVLPRVEHGLKPKDLMLVPARLAIALQEPYYAGRIKRETDRIWLAAMIDAEGCLFIHKRKAGQHNGQGYYRQNATFSSGLEVCNTSRAIVERCMEIAGIGSICEQTNGRKQTLYRWNVRSNESRDLIREVYPYLIGKQQQARILYGCPSSGQQADAAHEALILLHNGSETTVDFPDPPSMLEPGWYLRSSIVWSKPNPMPESVTDRPTSAHEHIFLLTRSARYMYDADAIRETYSEERGGVVIGRAVHGYNVARGGDLSNIGGYPQTHKGRNARNVWTITPKPYKGAHFATFSPELPERCIKAGTSERGGCPDCGAPWVRVVERTLGDREAYLRPKHLQSSKSTISLSGSGSVEWAKRGTKAVTTGWRPSCGCDAGEPVPQTVLDPFNGAGTTGLVAQRLGRRYIGIELNESYAEMSRQRIYNDAPLLQGAAD